MPDIPLFLSHRKTVVRVNNEIAHIKQFKHASPKKVADLNKLTLKLHEDIEAAITEGKGIYNDLHIIYDEYGPERLKRRASLWVDTFVKAWDQIAFNFQTTILSQEVVTSQSKYYGYFFKSENHIKAELLKPKPALQLEMVAFKFAHYVNSSETYVNDLVEQLLKLETPDINKEADNKEEDAPPNVELIHLFKKVSHYKAVMDLLASKNYCDPLTGIWKDTTLGYMSLIVSVIRDLRIKRYYKSVRLTAKIIKQVAMNTFGVDISMDAINKKSEKNMQPKETDFIPYADTLP